jgi:hypothetical protein
MNALEPDATGADMLSKFLENTPREFNPMWRPVLPMKRETP